MSSDPASQTVSSPLHSFRVLLLSRGITQGLYLTTSLRTVMVIGLLVGFFRECRDNLPLMTASSESAAP